ncbi:hypothetical protein EJB05_57283, partial [Eragrostis curvula]
FDTERWQWWHAGKWRLPFYDRAEYVPELNLWFGLSSCRPFHLCASDLSTMDFERPPVILQTLADFDMPKSWSPIRLDLINLGSGRFCVVKMFHCMRPPVGMGYSDEDGDDDEVFDYPDLIHWEFTVLTGIEVVCCDVGDEEQIRRVEAERPCGLYSLERGQRRREKRPARQPQQQPDAEEKEETLGPSSGPEDEVGEGTSINFRGSFGQGGRMSRRFLNLVMENLDTGLYSLRRLNLYQHLFYPSTALAEAAMARSEAAVNANAERQAGYKHGLRFLNATATSLGPLPATTINFKPCGPSTLGDTPLDLVALLGDEGKILCADTVGRTSLYDADSHAVMTVPDLRSSKGRDAIPISIARATADGRAVDGHPGQGTVLVGTFSLMINCSVSGVRSLPPPPFLSNPAYELPADIGTWTVVGGSSILISSTQPGIGTYCFDTVNCKWTHAGKWRLPFLGRAEYVPEHELWFGLSASRPFHLCASDLSVVDFEQPPSVLQTFADFDMPKSWSPFHLDLINLGSGRFCVVKIFHCTQPRDEMCSSDDDDDDEAYDCPDVIDCEFAVLTGVEVACCDDEAASGKLKIIRHQSRYHTFKDDLIHWVL